MGRYVKDIKTSRNPSELQRTVSEYLTGEGFERGRHGHEDVWKKGSGWLIGPQLVKATPVNGRVHLEAWTQFALLPGVYVGEMGTEGIFNAAAKRKLRGRVRELERLLG